MGTTLRTSTDNTPPGRALYVVWDRREGGPVSEPFRTREAARRYLGEEYRGRRGLEVRRVPGGGA